MIPEAPEQLDTITSDAELRRLIAGLRGHAWVALDTEFARERTYYPQLGLVQLAGPETMACVDPLALDSLAPVADLLADLQTTKVVHAGYQDIEILLQETGTVPAPVFDTQVAASLLGHPDQIGYAALVEAELGQRLAKAHTRTDWTKRPLAPEAVAYAADDVRYLAQLYPLLRDKLAACNRLAWLTPEFEAMVQPDQYRSDPEQAWRRIKGVHKLRPVRQQVLARLAAWRESQAMQRNRPRRWIVKDDVLLELARRKPGSRTELARVRGLPDAVIRRYGDDLLARLRAMDDVPDQPLVTEPALAPEQQPLADMLMAALRAQADAIQVSAGALANRREIERLAAGERALPVLHGWRHAAVGQTLLALLDGDITLRAGANGVVLEQADDADR